MEKYRCVGTVCADVVGRPRVQGGEPSEVEEVLQRSHNNSLIPIILSPYQYLLLQLVALLSCCSVCEHAEYCNQMRWRGCTGTMRIAEEEKYAPEYARKEISFQ